MWHPISWVDDNVPAGFMAAVVVNVVLLIIPAGVFWAFAGWESAELYAACYVVGRLVSWAVKGKQ